MPDRDVKTIRDLIYYQYAKIIARRAFSVPDGKEAKAQHYGFVKNTFRELKSGAKSWLEITRGNWQYVKVEKKCIYCGSESDLHKEHVVSKSLEILPKCKTCDVIQGIHNQIWACSGSNLSKETKELYEFYIEKYPGERKFYDLIPPLLEKKYFKTIINYHECARTLSQGDLGHEGKSRFSILILFFH